MSLCQWIPCGERMPPLYRIVLTFAPVGADNWQMKTNSTGPGGWCKNSSYEPTPTHWMPLPDPPTNPPAPERAPQ